MRIGDLIVACHNLNGAAPYLNFTEEDPEIITVEELEDVFNENMKDGFRRTKQKFNVYW